MTTKSIPGQTNAAQKESANAEPVNIRYLTESTAASAQMRRVNHTVVAYKGALYLYGGRAIQPVALAVAVQGAAAAIARKQQKAISRMRTASAVGTTSDVTMMQAFDDVFAAEFDDFDTAGSAHTGASSPSSTAAVASAMAGDYVPGVWRFDFKAARWKDCQQKARATNPQNSGPRTQGNTKDTKGTGPQGSMGHDDNLIVTTSASVPLVVPSFTSMQNTANASPSANNSAMLALFAPPSPRGDHSAVIVGSHMLVFGGRKHKAVFDDLFAFDFKTMLWCQVKHEKHLGPGPTFGHACVVVYDNTSPATAQQKTNSSTSHSIALPSQAAHMFVVGGVHTATYSHKKMIFAFDCSSRRWESYYGPANVDPNAIHVVEVAYVPEAGSQEAEPQSQAEGPPQQRSKYGKGKLYVIGFDEVDPRRADELNLHSAWGQRPFGGAVESESQADAQAFNRMPLGSSNNNFSAANSFAFGNNNSFGLGANNTFNGDQSMSMSMTNFSPATLGPAHQLLQSAQQQHLNHQRRSAQHIHVLDLATLMWSKILTHVSPQSPIPFRMAELRACLRYTGLWCAGSAHLAHEARWVFVLDAPPPISTSSQAPSTDIDAAYGAPESLHLAKVAGQSPGTAASTATYPSAITIHNYVTNRNKQHALFGRANNWALGGGKKAEEKADGGGGGRSAQGHKNPYGERSTTNTSPLASLPSCLVFSYSFETQMWSMNTVNDPTKGLVVEAAVAIAAEKHNATSQQVIPAPPAPPKRSTQAPVNSSTLSTTATSKSTSRAAVKGAMASSRSEEPPSGAAPSTSLMDKSIGSLSAVAERSALGASVNRPATKIVQQGNDVDEEEGSTRALVRRAALAALQDYDTLRSGGQNGGKATPSPSLPGIMALRVAMGVSDEEAWARSSGTGRYVSKRGGGTKGKGAATGIRGAEALLHMRLQQQQHEAQQRIKTATALPIAKPPDGIPTLAALAGGPTSTLVLHNAASAAAAAAAAEASDQIIEDYYVGKPLSLGLFSKLERKYRLCVMPLFVEDGKYSKTEAAATDDRHSDRPDSVLSRSSSPEGSFEDDSFKVPKGRRERHKGRGHLERQRRAAEYQTLLAKSAELLKQSKSAISDNAFVDFVARTTHGGVLGVPTEATSQAMFKILFKDEGVRSEGVSTRRITTKKSRAFSAFQSTSRAGSQLSSRSPRNSDGGGSSPNNSQTPSPPQAVGSVVAVSSEQLEEVRKAVALLESELAATEATKARKIAAMVATGAAIAPSADGLPASHLVPTELLLCLGGCEPFSDQVFAELLTDTQLTRGLYLPYKPQPELDEGYFNLVKATQIGARRSASPRKATKEPADDTKMTDAANEMSASVKKKKHQPQATSIGAPNLDGVLKATADDENDIVDVHLKRILLAGRPAEHEAVTISLMTRGGCAGNPSATDRLANTASTFGQTSRSVSASQSPRSASPAFAPAESLDMSHRSFASSPRPNTTSGGYGFSSPTLRATPPPTKNPHGNSPQIKGVTAPNANPRRRPFVPFIVPHADVVSANGKHVHSSEKGGRTGTAAREITTPQQALNWSHSVYAAERRRLESDRDETNRLVSHSKDEAKKAQLSAMLQAGARRGQSASGNKEPEVKPLRSHEETKRLAKQAKMEGDVALGNPFGLWGSPRQ